jgi:hypothetical protein
VVGIHRLKLLVGSLPVPNADDVPEGLQLLPESHLIELVILYDQHLLMSARQKTFRLMSTISARVQNPAFRLPFSAS